MSKEINFLASRRRQLTKQQLKDLRYFQISALFLGVAVALSIIIVGVQFYFSFQVNAVNDDIDITRQRILSNEEVEKSYIILVNKLNVLDEALDERRDKQKAINFFTQLFGPQVLIQQIAFDDDGRVLTMQFKSRDIFSMERIIEQLDEQQVRSEYPQITRTNLRRSDDGSYQVFLAVTISSQGGDGDEDGDAQLDATFDEGDI